MDKIIEIKGLSFSYDGYDKHSLAGVDLAVDKGDFVLLSGASGSGKTTLLRCINGMVPHFYGGKISGSARVCGMDVLSTPTKELAAKVGFVFQDPEDQLVTGDVERELAFGLENMGVHPGEMGQRISAVAGQVGISHLRNRPTSALSGGEKQKLAIASVLILEPEILILDEPFSQVDHMDAQDIATLLADLNRAGMTIIVSEHRDDLLVRHTHRRVFMSHGSISSPPMDQPPLELERPIAGLHPVIKVAGITFAYGARPILEDFDFQLFPNEFVALMGPNGSGKTTLAKHLNGLLKPQAGSVQVCGLDTRDASVAELSRYVGYMPQNPNELLFEDTVLEEVLFYPHNLGIADVDADKILASFGLLHYKDRYPRALSGGERQRLAMASIVSGSPRVLVLDEPTRGLDHGRRIELVKALDAYRRNGSAVLIITHDPHLAALADRVVEMGYDLDELEKDEAE